MANKVTVPERLSRLVSQLYNLKDNTLSTAPIPEPKELLELEVGDAKQPDTFYPQVKFKKWNNEVNYSVRLIDTYNGAVVETKDEKISWVKPVTAKGFVDVFMNELSKELGQKIINYKYSKTEQEKINRYQEIFTNPKWILDADVDYTAGGVI